MKRVNRWLWGLVLIAIGVVWALSALEIIDVNIFFRGWWTLFIIVPCTIGLITEDGERTGNAIGLLIGVCLLLGCQGLMRFDMMWKLIVPAVLIIVGLSFLFKDTIKSAAMKQAKKLQKENPDGTKQYTATFGEQKLNFEGEEFKGCKVQAIFGGVKLDLRDAKIEHDVVVGAESIFGGVTILIPEDVNVKVISTSVFGGVSNKHMSRKTKDEEANKVTVFVDAMCLFGGVDIK